MLFWLSLNYCLSTDPLHLLVPWIWTLNVGTCYYSTLLPLFSRNLQISLFKKKKNRTRTSSKSHFFFLRSQQVTLHARPSSLDPVKLPPCGCANKLHVRRSTARWVFFSLRFSSTGFMRPSTCLGDFVGVCGSFVLFWHFRWPLSVPLDSIQPAATAAATGFLWVQYSHPATHSLHHYCLCYPG